MKLVLYDSSGGVKFMRPLRMSEKLVLGVPKDVNPSNS